MTATHSSDMGRIWLDVPYQRKDHAKALGARWDAAQRSWYAARPGIRGLEHWERLPDLLPGEDRTFGGDTLFVDLIPETSWFRNVRAVVDPRDWDRLRQMVYRRAGSRCETCGAEGDKAAGIYLEAHERFDYDGIRGIQTLRRLICLCTACHTTTHIGLAGLRGLGAAAEAHLRQVTGMTQAQADDHIETAFALWNMRNHVEWVLNLSIITAAGILLSGQEPAEEPPAHAVKQGQQAEERPSWGTRLFERLVFGKQPR